MDGPKRSRRSRQKGARSARSTPAVRYVPSPEHKTHPGSWGAPQWHRRDPPITPCPTDLRHDLPQQWLHEALQHEFCWDDPDAVGETPPAYVYWRQPETNRFFIGQRTQRDPQNSLSFTYKGYPVDDADVPHKIADAFYEKGLIDENARKRLTRARRARYGAKP